ncbi:MAG: tRNA (adenosine(37)-N6)-threonylcarbamoyltransferase complex dimerization subunit type 1 TsaB [Ruminococcus sp.]|nr:tRNA (adenosine(37)-N6)-threonylcarbamoyltransferase complex dimerization subunit type 1 TsaB [Ruminococcus sp.]
MKILGIDTSGKVASVAVSDGGVLLWEQSVYTKLTHSQVIMPMVRRAMEDTGIGFDELNCVAVANGPGSYTGLRIGIGAVKGLCMGAPMLKCAGVSTLKALAYNCCAFEGRIIAVMRARPGIVYAAEFDAEDGKITRASPDRVCAEEELFGDYKCVRPIMLVGDWAGEVRKTYFDGRNGVRKAEFTELLQRAGSLCLAVESEPELICGPEELEVSYLQATKAEKDKAHS